MKRLAKTSNHAYKNSETIQIIFIDKHIIVGERSRNSKFSTHHKIYLWSHLATREEWIYIPL